MFAGGTSSCEGTKQSCSREGRVVDGEVLSNGEALVERSAMLVGSAAVGQRVGVSVKGASRKHIFDISFCVACISSAYESMSMLRIELRVVS